MLPRAETKADHLLSFLTHKQNYDRNHGPVARLNAASHKVIVDGLIENRLELTLANLSNDYPQHSVTCALQCAGNRRHSMRTRIKEVQGIDWNDGAIMNCSWEGPRLRDVLLQAGVASHDRSSDDLHAQFASCSQKCQEEDWYGGSIPLQRALAREFDVILAVKVSEVSS